MGSSGAGARVVRALAWLVGLSVLLAGVGLL